MFNLKLKLKHLILLLIFCIQHIGLNAKGTIGIKIINNVLDIKFVYLGLPILNHTNSEFPDEIPLQNDYAKIDIESDSCLSIEFGPEKSNELFVLFFQPNDSLEFEYDFLNNKLKCKSINCESQNEFIRVLHKYRLSLFSYYQNLSQERDDSLFLEKLYDKKINELKNEIHCTNLKINNHLLKELKLKILNSLHQYHGDSNNGKKLIIKICNEENFINNIHNTTARVQFFIIYNTSLYAAKTLKKLTPYLQSKFYILVEKDINVLSYYLQIYFYLDVRTKYFEAFGMDACKSFKEILPYIESSNVDLAPILNPYFDKDKCK